MSFASSETELARVADIEGRLVTATGPARQVALEELRLVSEAVVLREQGRRQFIVPSDPGLAVSLAERLDSFLVEVAEPLELDVRRAAHASSRSLAEATSVLAFGVALPLLRPWLATRSHFEWLQAIEWPTVLLVESLVVAISVLLYRRLQAHDGELRRLREKRSALRFVTAAARLTVEEPATHVVLERAFEMFVRHYEETEQPLRAQELLPRRSRA